jgi:hypothetical protein
MVRSCKGILGGHRAQQLAGAARPDYNRCVSTSHWTEAAVKAIDRAFFEVVESEPWEYSVELGAGAIGALAAIQDHEVPGHSRMDLLIARDATRRSEAVLRAIARLFASSKLPDRVQAPNGQGPEEEDEDLLQVLKEQAAAGKLLREDVKVAPTEVPPGPPRSTGHRLTQHTLTSVHIRRLRAYAETTALHELVTECDQALGPPVDPLVWALDLRRRLAGYYNALFIDGGTPLGHWTGHAWRQVALAWGRLFYYPDLPRGSDSDRDPDALEVFDPVVEAQALLRDVQPEDVPHDAQADLHRIKTARSYDIVSLRAMGRLWSDAQGWRLQRVQSELGRGRLDRS